MLNPLDHPICFATPKRLAPSAWHEHIPFAMYLVAILRPKIIVELGTHLGDSYCAFCQAVKELNLETFCYAIDTWRGDPQAGFYGPEVLADLRAYHDPFYGSFSRLVQSTFDEALGHFGDRAINLLHVDGYHTYEAVKHDFESWLPKMSTDGVILFHDINVRELDFGVSRFWNEIKSRYSHFEFIHGHGLGVLALGEVKSLELQQLLHAADEEAIRVRDFFFQLGNRLHLMFENEAQSHTIKDQSMRLQVQQEALNSFESELHRHRQDAAEKQRALQSVGAQLSQKDRALKLLSKQLSRQEEALHYFSSQIEDKERVAESLSALLTHANAKPTQERPRSWKKSLAGLLGISESP